MTKQIDEFAEIEAMKTIASAVKGLDEAALTRVFAWATGKYNLKSAGAPANVNTPAAIHPHSPTDTRQGTDTAEDLPATFSAASPESDTDKALVAAYWFQVIKGQADVDSYEVNNELKQLGHGVANITRAFDHLMEAKPQLVIQTRKSGKAKQARKKYRVTAEGIARVKQLIAAHQLEPQ